MMSLMLLLTGCVSPTAGGADGATGAEESFARRSEATSDGGFSAVWNPGEDIPGWEDYDCEELVPDYLDLEMNHFEIAGGRMDGCWDSSQCPVEMPAVMELRARRCVGGHCPSDPLATSRIWISMFSGLEDSGLPRAQGWYHNDPSSCGTANRTVSGGVGVDPDLGVWGVGLDSAGCAAYPDTPGGFDVCLSRVRPDEIRGELWVHELSYEEGGWPEASDYMGYVKISFDVMIAPGLGFYNRNPHAHAFLADGGWSAWRGWWYFINDYEHAWPWDEITDPAIRDRVMDMYLPYGDDHRKFPWTETTPM